MNNKKGEPMPNLTRYDFNVYEDKVPAADSLLRTSCHARRADNLCTHGDQFDCRARQTGAEPVSIMVLDEVTTKFQDEAFVRYWLKRYLNGQSDNRRRAWPSISRTS